MKHYTALRTHLDPDGTPARVRMKGTPRPDNEYLRELHAGIEVARLQPVREEGDILITPEGYRWRLEREVKVPDLVHPGDRIRTSYNSTGLVIELVPTVQCPCPYDQWGSKLCAATWSHPAILDFHRELTCWTIVFVYDGKKIFKNGKFRETDKGWLNELVAYQGRLLHLFENNDDEVFVIGPEAAAPDLPPTPTFQPTLF